MERESLEYLKTPVSLDDGDPTGHTVQVALLEDGERPEESDWHTAAWDTDNGAPVAVLLVGPGGVINPGPGAYRTWVKITAAPEIPVIKSPRFQIT